MVTPTTAEVGDALHHAPERFTAFVAVCAFAGMRLGGAGGLPASDIDFMRRELHIKRQVQRATGGCVDIRPPKFGSERTVHIPQGFRHPLRACAPSCPRRRPRPLDVHRSTRHATSPELCGIPVEPEPRQSRGELSAARLPSLLPTGLIEPIATR